MNQIINEHMTVAAAPGNGRRPGKGKLAVFLLVAFVLVAIVSACGSDGASPSVGPGDQAPAFTLPDQNSQTYIFVPGDGKDHIFVFYMGYF